MKTFHGFDKDQRSPGYNVQDVEDQSPCSTAVGKERMREEGKEKKLFKLKKWINKFLMSLDESHNTHKYKYNNQDER